MAADTRSVIVVPAYNEEATIGRVIQELRAVVSGDEVVVIDDGSRDRTGALAADHGATVLRHAINLGYTRALQTGMKYALTRRAASCVMFDADGQHDAVDVPRLKERAHAPDCPDMVIGSRFVGDRSYDAPLARRIGMVLFSQLTALAGRGRIFDTTCGLRWMSRAVILDIVDLVVGDFHSEVLIYLLMRGQRIVEVPATVHERTYGQSMHTPLTSAVYPLKTLVAMALLMRSARQRGRNRHG